MKHKLLILILTLMAGLNAKSQSGLSLSLSGAQDYAIENNKSLQNAKLDLKISELKVKETIAQGFPQISASVDYTSYFNYEMEFNFGMGGGTSFTPDQLSQAFQNTVNQFPGYTQEDLYKFQAGTFFNNQLSSMLPATTIKMTDQSTGKIQFSQLIFSGQYWVGVQTAKLGKSIAEQGLENSVLNIKETVTNTYFMILVTQQSLDIFSKSIENLKKILGHTKKMYETGILEQTDVDQLTIQLALLENNERSMKRGVEMTYNLLRFQLGVEPDTKIELTESLDALLARLNNDAENQSSSFENNPAYRMMESQEAISERMVKMEQMAYAPTLAGFYAYNQKFLTTGFDMTPNHIAGFTLNIPVFSSGARKHKVNQAKIQLEQARISKSMVSDQLALQEKQLLSDLKSAMEDYKAQKENVAVARRVYDNINRKFEQGMVSSLDLTQSNGNYLQAESNYIQSTMKLIQAQIALDKLYNEL